jgi:hypothetical protein
MASRVDVLARCTTSAGKSSYLRPTMYSESFNATFPVSSVISILLEHYCVSEKKVYEKT